jgi:glyoxylate reductase
LSINGDTMESAAPLARVLVTRQIPRAGLAVLAGKAHIHVLSGRMPPARTELIEALGAGWDGILSTLTEQIDGEVMDACPGLRVIANMAVGYDNIDVEAATKRRIVVTNTPGVLTETTADLAWTLLMAAARGIPAATAYLRNGEWRTWEPEALLGQDISDATLGIVGLGRIGVAVAKRARGFNMRVLYHDPIPRLEAAREVGAHYRDLPDLLRDADFVSVHVPLLPQTVNMFGQEQFALMKPTAVFINTSRGGVVDQAALYQALRDRTIFAAGLDVYAEEPLPLSDPLLTLDNVVLTPHIASASFATRNRMATVAAENLLAVLRGQRPQYLVNPGALLKDIF